ncbi:MAG: hypothetical protein DWQ05_07285 [Calditrichaeota bacterium]|nr:MAG: hypothetical protein DWQ05_07285 [Calditrichota bacterium]
MNWIQNKFSPVFLVLAIFTGTVLGQTPSPKNSPIGAGESISVRFPPPVGYRRIEVKAHSFAHFLRHLPLRPQGSPVQNFRGQIFKPASDTTVAAVVNLDIRGKKLEQCMDILQRLFAEYCLAEDKSEDIKFLLPDKSLLTWKSWQRGWRPQRTGGSFPIFQLAPAQDSRENFEAYVREIFYYSGTQTNYFGLKSIEINKIKIGDFIIKRGRKGHAVILVDIAVNEAGQQIAIFAQGDTPACELHLLKNKDGSPWLPLDFSQNAPNLPIAKKMFWDGLRRF